MKLSTYQFRILLFKLSALCFIPFLGNAPLFDWDEINFAESAREMIVTGDYARVQINFQPFWEKPPLFFWLQVASMKLFGINEFAARFPNALFGIITALTLFEMGRKLKSNQLGFIWACCMIFSFLPFIYFKSGIIDPVFNYFIFVGIWFLYGCTKVENKLKSRNYALFTGLFLGLAVLTKGPVALLLVGVTFFVYWAIQKFKPILSFLNGCYILLAILLTTFIWYGPETIKNGTWFLEQFVTYQIRLFTTPDAGHGQPFYYHFIVILIGCFPISIIALKHVFSKTNNQNINATFLQWMYILFSVVLIIFSITTTKIVHYSSLCYLPLSGIAAFAIEKEIQQKVKWSLFGKISYGFIGGLLGLILLLIPLVGMNIQQLVPFIKDPFAVENLKAAVSWTYLDLSCGIIWLVSLTLCVIYLHKNEVKKALTIQFAGIAITTLILLTSFVPRIAGYTQQAAVDFYISKQHENVYIETLHFKSFAQYFYSQKKGISPLEIKNSKDPQGYYNIDTLRNWYLTGTIDKPVYFVVKSTHLKEYIGNKELKVLGQKNGFVFLLRKPKQ
jgi:4-amino-4-deoxy-L-arabinose transferase-like glycosyltransferase